VIKARDPISQRLVRKGAFLEETYTLFRGWKEGVSFDANFEAAFQGQFRSEGWRKEVYATLRRRFRDVQSAQPLIVLARHRFDIFDWQCCLHFWVAIHETLYRSFLTDWLYPEFQAGRLMLRTEDTVQYVLNSWKSLSGSGEPLSEYGATRTARDLLRMARDFGLLEGEGRTKTFASLHFSDELILYFCHVIAAEENSTSRVPNSNLWKLLLLDHTDVHTHLLRLHQYRKLEYQVAGSLVELNLPCSNPVDYAERMVG
jgi:BrxA